MQHYPVHEWPVLSHRPISQLQLHPHPDLRRLPFLTRLKIYTLALRKTRPSRRPHVCVL